MFYTYILKSLLNNAYYVGSCGNINERFNLHNSGKVKSTKAYIPWQLVYKEEHKNSSDAIRREMQIKSWKKRSAIERLIKEYKI